MGMQPRLRSRVAEPTAPGLLPARRRFCPAGSAVTMGLAPVAKPRCGANRAGFTPGSTPVLPGRIGRDNGRVAPVAKPRCGANRAGFTPGSTPVLPGRIGRDNGRVALVAKPRSGANRAGLTPGSTAILPGRIGRDNGPRPGCEAALRSQPRRVYSRLDAGSAWQDRP
jgi:hypothetical protein